MFGAASVFTQADLTNWDPRRRVGKKRAHSHLSDMRQEMHANGENSRRLDDDELVGDYVCSRPDAASLVGDGISAAWALFLYSPDPNTRLPHVPGRQFDWVLEAVDGTGARFDWVLERVGGTAVRIHPGSNSHGTPVYGRMEQWAPPQDGRSAPAATRGEAVMKGGGKGGFQERHQVDVLGRSDAHKFLEACLRTWEEQPHPRGCFSQSLLDGARFPWWLYLNSTEWGRELAPQVQEFGMCWLSERNRPCFYVRGPGVDGRIDVLGSCRKPYAAVADLDSVVRFA